MRTLLLLCCLLPAAVLGYDARQVVEDLIREAWLPDTVRVEWEFRGKDVSLPNTASNWRISSPHPRRLAGSLTLKLTGNESGEQISRTVSGTARIFGQSWTPRDYIPARQQLTASQLKHVELEWTYVKGEPVMTSSRIIASVSTRGLVPGRPICAKDIKASPVIRKGQPVTLEYQKDNILIALHGRALHDGAPGDIIPVKIELEHGKRFRGSVIDSNTVRFLP